MSRPSHSFSPSKSPHGFRVPPPVNHFTSPTVARALLDESNIGDLQAFESQHSNGTLEHLMNMPVPSLMDPPPQMQQEQQIAAEHEAEQEEEEEVASTSDDYSESAEEQEDEEQEAAVPEEVPVADMFARLNDAKGKTWLFCTRCPLPDASTVAGMDLGENKTALNAMRKKHSLFSNTTTAKSHVTKEHAHITIIDTSTKKRSKPDDAAKPKAAASANGNSSSSKQPQQKKQKSSTSAPVPPAVAGHKPAAAASSGALFSSTQIQHFHDLVIKGRRQGLDLEAKYPFHPIQTLEDFMRSLNMLASLELMPNAMRCAKVVVNPEEERRAAAEKREHSNRACFLAHFVEEPEAPPQDEFEGL